MHRDHARAVTDDLMDRDGAVGVLLTGSVALGHHDEHSDVDLEFVVGPDRYADRDGEGGRVVRDAPGLRRDELVVDWGLTTLDRIGDDLGWDDDVLLFVYAATDVLADPTGRVGDLLARYRTYPEDVRREKLFAYWFHATGNAYDARRALARDDRTTAELYLREAVEDYAALLFVLDGRFVPYRKWRRRELATLDWTPEGFEDLLVTVATGDDATAKVEALDGTGDAVGDRLRGEWLDDDRVDRPFLFDPAYEPSV